MTAETEHLIKLANAQVQDIFAKLKIDYSYGGQWLSCACPIHNGDNPHGFGFNLEKGYWKCFTHNCHNKWGCNIVSLVAAVLNYSYADARSWISNNVKDVNIPKAIIKKEDKIFPERCLLRLFRTDFYTKRGFSQATVDDFEHGQAQTGKMFSRVVFPIRDADGMIRGFSGRWSGKECEIDGKLECVTDSGRIVPKWKHKATKTNYLYNFYRAKTVCQDELIVVESIGNVMRFWDAGKKNCVACLGSSLSIKQAQMMIASTKRVVLAFDNDKAGRKVMQKSQKVLEQYVDVRIIIPPEGKDWAEMTNEEVLNIYGNVCKSE